VRYSILIGLPVITYAFALSAWGWGKSDHFKWANEGWFGQSTYQGGHDKFAHLYSQYFLFRGSYSIFSYTENGGMHKWTYSVLFTTLLGLAIEVGDAYAGDNGFSWRDLIANSVGLATGILLEKFPIIDSFFSISGEYWPTKYFRKRPNMIWMAPDDYSGWKFMINIKLAGFKDLGWDTPEFTRYIMLDVGYYARGFSKYDDDYHHLYLSRHRGTVWRKRYIFFGISLNMMEVVKDFFTDKKSFACRSVQQPFKYYHLPIGVKNSIKIK